MTANDGEERKMLNLSREKYDEGPHYDVLFVKMSVRTLVETWKMCAT